MFDKSAYPAVRNKNSSSSWTLLFL